MLQIAIFGSTTLQKYLDVLKTLKEKKKNNKIYNITQSLSLQKCLDV